ncbi:MAG: M4 family metallopeptidase [Acidobacteria bacterium]|nr:M4 family metallopeptidase [Acidobacteriota bacterium]
MAVAVTRADGNDLRAWDQQLDQMIRDRDLRVREVQPDAFVAARQHERLDQYYRGVRIFGGDLTRQISIDGTVSIFGLVHAGIDLDASPRIAAEAARQSIVSAVSGQALDVAPELGVLPLSDGYHLAYRGRVRRDLEPVIVYVDANTGALLQTHSEFIYEVGLGKGTFGDSKKLSTTSVSGTFLADDRLRPAEITTYDMKGNLSRTQAIVAGTQSLAAADMASSTNNDNWSDPTVVDAHVYAGWYYDYIFKRFGRRGIDGRDRRMSLITHPASLSSISTASLSILGTYYVNAFNCLACAGGNGVVVFGEGAPTGFAGPGVQIKPFSAAFDVVAHELTHGITGATAGLNFFPFSEAGGLDEGFSDIFGVSTAFFFEPVRTSPLPASYLLGRDVTVPGGAFLPAAVQLGAPGYIARSLSDPSQTGNPDHYSLRGTERHFNATILSHAFYLAIEGGTNRTSRLSVQGVGAGNRDQIEKVFFRALTVLLPSNANFALARAATLQAARDLYGAGGTVERAVTQAWDAVGVQPRTVPTAAVTTVPTTATDCPGVSQPSWGAFGTVSAGSSNLSISLWQIDLFDAVGSRLLSIPESSAAFGSLFNQCGPGSSRIQAQTDACAALCIGLDGLRSGAVQFSFTAIDDAGRTLNFNTPRVALAR